MTVENPQPEIITEIPGITKVPETEHIADVVEPTVSTAEAHEEEVAPITNFSEAKALKRWQESQTPEGQAAANAMEEERQRRIADQDAQLAEKARQLAQNPKAITGVPKS